MRFVLSPVVVLAFIGCRGAAPAEPASTSVEAEESLRGAAAPAFRIPAAGTSIEGRPLEVQVLGEGPETVLFVATLHGDEAAGTPLLLAFVQRLAAGPGWLRGRRAVVVPIVNPDGFARDARSNARGVDLNRNFPARNFRGGRRHGTAPLSEPESRFVHGLVQAHRPQRIVTFHQAANLIDYDGPAGSLAHALAASSPLEVRRMGARLGSLGSWAGADLGIPVVTVELPRAADRLAPEESWERYGELLVTALRGAPASLPAEDAQGYAEGERAP